MAATNTAFWVENGWDGSESIMVKSRAYCTRLPEQNRALLLSESTVKTTIVTLQGVQAIWEIIIIPRSFTKSPRYIPFSLATLFMPFAIYGLFRLPAALWLSEDGAYATSESSEEKLSTVAGRQTTATNIRLIASLTSGKALIKIRSSKDTSAKQIETRSKETATRFEPSENLPSQSRYRWVTYIIGFVYLLCLLPFLGVTVFLFINTLITSEKTFSGTSLTLNLMYMIFLFVTIVTFAFYVAIGRNDTTVIPCIQSRWYKLYTMFLALMSFVAFCFACIETYRYSCIGSLMQMYTTNIYYVL